MKLRRKIIEIAWKKWAKLPVNLHELRREIIEIGRKKQRKMLVDKQDWLENFAFVMSPETMNKREENAFLSFAPTPAKVSEWAVILVLINWLSAFYIFATLGELTLRTR